MFVTSLRQSILIAAMMYGMILPLHISSSSRITDLMWYLYLPECVISTLPEILSYVTKKCLEFIKGIRYIVDG